MIYQTKKEDAHTIAELAILMWTKHTIGELTADFEEILSNDENAIFLLSIKMIQLVSHNVSSATTTWKVPIAALSDT